MNRFLHLRDVVDWINAAAIHDWARYLTRTYLLFLPAVQILHVLTICLVVGAAGVFSLRMAGLMRAQSLADMAARLLPWAWGAIAAQFVTGLFMVIDRPERAFGSLTFPYKMIMLVAAIALTGFFHWSIRTDPDYWDRNDGRRATARALGVVAAALWVGVIFAGRWIAYDRVPL